MSDTQRFDRWDRDHDDEDEEVNQRAYDRARQDHHDSVGDLGDEAQLVAQWAMFWQEQRAWQVWAERARDHDDVVALEWLAVRLAQVIETGGLSPVATLRLQDAISSAQQLRLLQAGEMDDGAFDYAQNATEVSAGRLYDRHLTWLHRQAGRTYPPQAWRALFERAVLGDPDGRAEDA